MIINDCVHLLQGTAPFFEACSADDTEIFEIFLEKYRAIIHSRYVWSTVYCGELPNSTNCSCVRSVQRGASPLHAACKGEAISVATALLSLGADVNEVDDKV
jgi:ankyrin repeat protein